jgi:hypothetical protein
VDGVEAFASILLGDEFGEGLASEECEIVRELTALLVPLLRLPGDLKFSRVLIYRNS